MLIWELPTKNTTPIYRNTVLYTQVTVIGILEKFYSNLGNCDVPCLSEISDSDLRKLIDTIVSPFEVGLILPMVLQWIQIVKSPYRKIFVFQILSVLGAFDRFDKLVHSVLLVRIKN